MVLVDFLRFPLLVVDDEQDNLDAFRFAFRKMFSLHFALGGSEALTMLDAVQPAVVVSDQRMPGMDGIDLLEQVRQRRPSTVGVLLTAYTDLAVLLSAIHSGAVYRYVQKPWDADDLTVTLRQCIERYAVLDDNRRLREQIARYAGYLERARHDPLDFGTLAGESSALQTLHQQLADIAPGGTTVLLCGEPGTGKRVVALALHTQSDREGRPFVELSAAAYTPEGQVRELRGWRAGAVPGGLEERAGRFEVAHGGTLFIEDVDVLGKEAQSVLLRALETHAITRLGDDTPGLPFDVRVVASTTRDLRELEKAGLFLGPLRSRLAIVDVHVPALRDRLADLPSLCEHILSRLARRSRRSPREMTARALHKLQHYAWPGNLRELENVVERAAVLAHDEAIDAPHLLFAEATTPDSKASEVATATARRLDLPERLEEIERQELLVALEQCHGNKAEVARRLGVQRTTLYYRLKRLGIDP